MSVATVPLANDHASPKEIFRFAATLFSDVSDEFSTTDAQLQMIKCMFAKYENRQMSKAEIIAGLLDVYKYHVSEDEIDKLLKNAKKSFHCVVVDGAETFCMKKDTYVQTLELQDKGIDYYIDMYIQEKQISDDEKCREAVHKYLYELTTTNINSYRTLLGGNRGINFHDTDFSVDINVLDDEERLFVHEFLCWDNPEKDEALTSVVYTCLEYCLIVNGDSPNSLMKGIIRQRVIYLDTNLIFRALGINGESRKTVIHSFLKKCQQAKIKIVILSQTKKEFFDTANIYIANIERFPRGAVDPEIYDCFSDYNLYAFYNAWHFEHPALSLKYFKIYLETIYDDFVKQFSIIDDEKIPTSVSTAHTFGSVRTKYAQSIQQKKQEHRAERNWEWDVNPNNNHDATIIRYIEMLRETVGDEKDIFLVSTDKVLRSWDMGRSDIEYPVVIYPSQLFIILVKLCGRSDDDYRSFVSFINIKPHSQQINAEKANIIISGISSITEDVNKQRGIIKAAYGGDFQRIIQSSQSDEELYDAAKQYSINYLDSELEDSSTRLNQAHQVIDMQNKEIDDLETQMSETKAHAENQAKQASHKEQGYQAEIKQLTNKNEQQRKKVCEYAEKKTRFAHIFKWYIVPVLIIVYALMLVAFVTLQFLWCDASWNIVTKIVEAIDSTTFGQNVEGYIAVIDGAGFAILLSVMVPYFWVKPWDSEKRKADKVARVEKYIKKIYQE